MAKPDPVPKASDSLTQVRPMDLKLGNRLTDDMGAWEVVGRLYTIGGGKNARARIQRVGRPETHELRTWDAHQRISVKRGTKATKDDSLDSF